MRIITIDDKTDSNIREGLLDGICRLDSLAFGPASWDKDTFSAHAANGYDILGAAAEDGILCVSGFFVLRCLDGAEVLKIAVDEGLRHRGIGTLFMDFMIRESARRGQERMFLEVRAGNKAASGLYEKKGFEVISVRRGYYKNPAEDALIMALDLENLKSDDICQGRPRAECIQNRGGIKRADGMLL